MTQEQILWLDRRLSRIDSALAAQSDVLGTQSKALAALLEALPRGEPGRAPKHIRWPIVDRLLGRRRLRKRREAVDAKLRAYFGERVLRSVESDVAIALEGARRFNREYRPVERPEGSAQ